jgi:hypothetical protein
MELKMKVKDLLFVIESSRPNYPDLDDWDIALEQHPHYKDCSNCNKPEDSIILKECYGIGCDELFIKSHAIGCVHFVKEKTLGIQIHY